MPRHASTETAPWSRYTGDHRPEVVRARLRAERAAKALTEATQPLSPAEMFDDPKEETP